MAATSSTRWFFSDWLSDPGIRAVSLRARGLWIDLLCVMGANSGRDYGLLKINGQPTSLETIARLVQSSHEEIGMLVTELERHGVFSRTRHGVIYCRRMVRARKSRENGKLGGNPNLLKDNDSRDQDNHPLLTLPNTLGIERIERRKNGHLGEKIGKQKPAHGCHTKDRRRVWFDHGTTEWEAYAADFREHHDGRSPRLYWNNSGSWFNWVGEIE
jgi:hypothetical protein